MPSGLESDDITLTLVKEGDHRLSEPGDLDRLRAVTADLSDLAMRAGA